MELMPSLLKLSVDLFLFFRSLELSISQHLIIDVFLTKAVYRNILARAKYVITKNRS